MDRSQSWGGLTVLYAGKDFYDAKHGRRVYFANVCAPPARPQSLARVLTFHPELQQLVYAPLAEQSELRVRQTASVNGMLLHLGQAITLTASNQSEISANFSRPTTATAVFGIRLHIDLRADGGERPTQSTLEAFVNYSTGSITSLNEHDDRGIDVVTVGIRDPATNAAGTNSLSLLSRDTQITIRCFVDKTLVECFFQGGRVALTMPLAPIADQNYCHFAKALTPPHFQRYAVFSEGGEVHLLAAEAYDVDDIWENQSRTDNGVVAPLKTDDDDSGSILCIGGGLIAHSNRSSAATACVGAMGQQCHFRCDAAYLAIGRHVCQSYSQGAQTFLNRTFFGGRCERLCPATSSPCHAGLVPTRFNSSDSIGPCLQTVCSTADDALRKLAKGNYALWQLARNNRTGIYIAGVDLTLPPAEQPFSQGATGETGLGLTFECVAAAMGWVTRAEAQARILLTLRSLSGLTPGFTLPQNRRGFSPTFIDSGSGAVWANQTGTQGFALMSTDLMHAGILFAKTYFERADPDSSTTAEISRLATALFAGVQWNSLLCGDDGQLDGNGTNIPMVVDWADGCSALMPLDKDGYYEFNEEFLAVDFAWQTTCGTQPVGQCSNKGIERMWQRWQGRRMHPNHSYKAHPLLSMWSAYVVHLPYYMTHAFNSDPVYSQLFYSHWQAEWEFYNSSQYYAGEQGRYGLGAGPLDASCAGGRRYAADLFLPYSGPVCPSCVQGDHCRIFSPSSVAGYLPAAPSIIRSQILALLATGETVYPLPTKASTEDLGDFILWRKSLLFPGWSCGGPPNTYVGVTTVDVSSELFGLSTLWLGADWYANNTNHFGAKRFDT